MAHRLVALYTLLRRPLPSERVPHPGAPQPLAHNTPESSTRGSLPAWRVPVPCDSFAGAYSGAMVKQKRAGEDAIGTDIDLMTIKEVAEALKVSVQSVRRLQYGRHVRFFKIGGSVRFAKADITAYLERQTVEPMH